MALQVLDVQKVIGSLPSVLTPNTFYAVRVGQGYDLYLSDATGAVAHRLNPNFNGLVVGGRNYAEDGDFTRGKWLYSTGLSSDRNHVVQNGVVRVIGNSTIWKQWQLHAKMGSLASRNNNSEALALLETNTVYTLSFEARRVSGSPNIWVSIRANTDSSRTSNVDVYRKSFTLTDDWQRYTITENIPHVDSLDFWRIIFGYNQTGEVEYRKIKLEKGIIPTDYAPAPEDNQSEIDTLKAEIAELKRQWQSGSVGGTGFGD